MRIEILAIGDELLDGRVTDTNTVRLALALGEVGQHLVHRATVTDDIGAIVEAARAAVGRGAELCVVSGGLGPTTDDLTAEAFARLAGVPLARDAAQAQRIIDIIESRGRSVSANQLRQAERPQGSEVLFNAVGTAPGFALSHGGCRFVSLPGVPREFDAMVEQSVVGPMRAGAAPILRRGLYCFGLMEAEIDRRLAAVHESFAGVRLQFRVKFPEIHVTMHAPPEQAHALDAAYAHALEVLGAHVFASHEAPFAAVVLKLLQARGATLGLAESCTGGLVADLLTDIPGSSSALTGAVVSYDNAAKVTWLGVQEASLAAHGAVSEVVVGEMAAGIRRALGSTYGLAVSGIAGPGGGTADKPVGTVWLGLAGPDSLLRTHRLSLPYERRNNKLVSAYSALDLLRRELTPAH